MEIIHSFGAHERQLHVRVRVDAAGDDQFIGCIDHSDPRRDLEIRSDIDYLAILDVDVAEDGAVLVDDCTSSDQDAAGLRHVCWKSVHRLVAVCELWLKSTKFMRGLDVQDCLTSATCLTPPSSLPSH